MHEFGYTVQGFLTVRRDSVRIPLSGSLGIHTIRLRPVQRGSYVRESIIERKVLDAEPVPRHRPDHGRVPGHRPHRPRGQLFAVATVEAVITGGHAAGRTWLSNGSCRTASQAIVPLRSRPGFRAWSGAAASASRCSRPPFTGCGWLAPIVNRSATGSGNAAVIDLVPVTPAA